MFSDHDLTTIRAAVEAAERRTRGEIVPMVVPVSARYRDASYLAGLILALVALAVLLSVDYGWGRWQWKGHHPGWIMIGAVAAYALGSFIGCFPRIIRLLTSDERMAMKVRLRAERAFYEQGLHKTKEGTGILILLSVLERRAQILADQAIDTRVPPGTWDALVQTLVAGIQAGRHTEAFCQVVARCGDLLAVHFPAHEGDNPNELPDELIRGT
ncbi:MAG: TPM domain-containing protein [Nitrospirota bacterium]|nr:TPM domain-containing protein [Nitrospirota bacterium]